MRNLAEMSSSAATTALSADSVIVLPTGAIEHHGPHLPLATDQLIADAVAAAAVDLAAADGVDVWRIPGLAYTKSDEHHWASGTIWLGWNTMMSTVVEIGRSVAATPARRLAFLNGHGGNECPPPGGVPGDPAPLRTPDLRVACGRPARSGWAFRCRANWVSACTAVCRRRR